MRIEFLGAAHTVTGSCYLLETGAHKLLIDCGMFQGGKRIRQLNTEAFRFNPGEIECLLLTHAHIDHCGLIPRLCREGFKGPVYATKVTCELAHIMLPDSAHIQESDTELMNRKGQRSGDTPVKPLYTMDDASEALQHNRDLLQIALDQMAQGITVFDKDFRLTCWNRQYRALFDLPDEMGQVGVSLDQVLRDEQIGRGEGGARLREQMVGEALRACVGERV